MLPDSESSGAADVGLCTAFRHALCSHHWPLATPVLVEDTHDSTNMFVIVPKHSGPVAHLEPGESARGLTRTPNACQACKVRKAKVSRGVASPLPPCH